MGPSLFGIKWQSEKNKSTDDSGNAILWVLIAVAVVVIIWKKYKKK